MKSSYLVLGLPLAVSAVAISTGFDVRPATQLSRRVNSNSEGGIHRRQEEESFAGIYGAFQEFSEKGAGAALQPVKVVDTKAVYRATATRKTIRWGPIVLPAANNATQERGKTMDPLGFAYYKLVAGMPADATYLYMEPKIVYENGSIANINSGVYLHHIMMMELGKDEPLPQNICLVGEKPPFAMPKPMPISAAFGIGNDIGGFMFTTQDGKLNSGYYRNPSDSMILGGELVNYQNVEKTIYVDIEVEYVPGKPAGLMEASGTILNMAGCSGGLGFNIPDQPMNKPYNITSKPFVVEVDGYLLQQRGHLHDGGEAIKIKINGKEACTSQATYGGEYGTMKDSAGKVTWETIYRMSVCTEMIAVRKGDLVTLTAFYNPGVHPMRENMDGMKDNEMGIMTWFFALKAKDAEWEDPKKYSNKISAQ